MVDLINPKIYCAESDEQIEKCNIIQGHQPVISCFTFVILFKKCSVPTFVMTMDNILSIIAAVAHKDKLSTT